MTTKEQERKALERIRKIIADLGEDSYVGTAFEGCFEIAETNIENDWACSMKGRADMFEHDAEILKEKVADLERAYKDAERIANAKIESADSWCARYHEADDLATKHWNAFREQEDRADALEQEVEKLRGKLYGPAWVQDTIVTLPDGTVELHDPIDRTTDRLVEILAQVSYLRQSGSDVTLERECDDNFETTRYIITRHYDGKTVENIITRR